MRSVALRAASRTPTPTEPDPMERRATWLSSWGTFVSAVAAAVGLIFTGVVTYFSAAAVVDQQALTKEQQQRDRQSQASQVGFWYANGKPNKDDIAVVSNRSPDALYELVVSFTFLKWPPDLEDKAVHGANDREVKAEYFTASIPPCTRRIFNKKAMHTAFDRLAKNTHIDVEQPVSTVLVFRDAQGVQWARGTTLRELSAFQGTILSTQNWAKRLRSGELVPELPYRGMTMTQPEPYCGKN